MRTKMSEVLTDSDHFYYQSSEVEETVTSSDVVVQDSDSAGGSAFERQTSLHSYCKLAGKDEKKKLQKKKYAASEAEDSSGKDGQELIHNYCKPMQQKKKKMKQSEDESDEDDSVTSVYCICRTKETNRFMIGCDNCNEWYHGDCISITETYAKNIQQFFCLMCRERDPTLEIKFKEKKERKDSADDKHKEGKKKKKKQHLDSPRKSSLTAEGARKSTRRCGECISCYRSEDCGRCDFCKDMRKFGGPNKIRQKCRQRQCLNFGLVLGKKPQHKDKESFYEDEQDDEDETEYFQDSPHKTPEKRARSPSSDNDEDYEPTWSTCRSKHRKGSQKRTSRRNKSSNKYKTKESSRREHDKNEKEEEVPKQCYGPGCTSAARSGSKYCSDECGLKLATSRIYELLPHRIQQWQSTTCFADENGRRNLDVIRLQQQEARQILMSLEKRQQDLEALIEKAKKTTIAADQENTDGESEEAELSIYCVTCGHEIAAKTALKHMEKCFNKYESQTSFGSIFKTRIEGSSMFCDYYNPLQRTYCKRLRILCPEHSKEAKVNDDEVCGCPLVQNVFESTGEFCRASRKKCIKHHCWEKLVRAEIDMERVRQWLKIDDLFEQERNIRMAMANRGGVLALMLHQTYPHDAMYDVSMIQPPPATAS